MIQATFYRNSDNILVGFETKGHAGFAKYNKDIVCSAVSVLTINTVNAIGELTENKFKLNQGESGFLQFKFLETPDGDGQILLRTLELGLSAVSEEYGEKYLTVLYKEV